MIILWLGCLGVVPEASAQTGSQRDQNRTSRGRDFYMTFLPNVHEDAGSPINVDSLYIFITCDVPTQGVITFRNRNGVTSTRNFAITNPAQVFTFAVPYRDFELQGFNLDAGRTGNPNSQNERVAPQFFRVTANNEVTVYGLNQAYLTSDAFLALPVTALGREYVIMSYNSDGDGARFNINAPDQSTPSQFAVVATENDTEVQIIPSQPTFTSRTTAPQTVRLQRGDVYLVQADVRIQNGLTDLTGSRVIASRPVAVFGSHQRALIPIADKARGLATRDHLVEQMPPIETWGRQAFVTPYPRPVGAQLDIGSDLYRVVAGYDNTRIFINGAQVRTLNAGEFFEAALTAPLVITASDQIMVAQFKKTSSSAENQFNGDPFMMIIPTVEQYDNSYRFINPQAIDGRLLRIPGSTTNLLFREHYVTIVAPTSSLGSIRVDETLVGAQRFQPIANSGYSFANIQVSAGVHTARGDSAFAIYVFGYGLLNSYGYIGGGRLRIIAPDRNAPVITGTPECFGFSGVAYDTLLTDSRIRSVDFEQATAGTVGTLGVIGNVQAAREPFTPFADSVRFRLQLSNSFQDGSIVVVARDSIGFTARLPVLIPGLTVSAEERSTSQQPAVRTITLPVGRSRVLPVTLINYGQTSQTLGSVNGTLPPFEIVQNCGLALRTRLVASTTGSLTSNPAMTVQSGFAALTIPPNSSTTVTLAFEALQTGTCTIRLSLQTSCGRREVLVLNVAVLNDTVPPALSVRRDDCARTITFSAEDRAPAISGIERFEVSDLVNCTITRLEPITAATVFASQGRGVLTIINPRLDALFTIRAIDSAGNVAIIRDTVQGFTLVLVPTPPATSVSADSLGRFGSQRISALLCRSLTYQNIGLKPFVINQWAPNRNVFFSMPATQFPAVIRPGERRTFTFCFSPLEQRSYADTLRLFEYCVEDVFPLSGTGTPVSTVENTRCDVAVRLTTSSAPQEYFMEQNFPNPAFGQTIIRFAILEPSPIRLVLYDALGKPVQVFAEGVFGSGEYEVLVNVERLESGVYWYELRYGIGAGARSSIRSITVFR
jgi:hypothetical protein